jgi:hypothetical protein
LRFLLRIIFRPPGKIEKANTSQIKADAPTPFSIFSLTAHWQRISGFRTWWIGWRLCREA